MVLIHSRRNPINRRMQKASLFPLWDVSGAGQGGRGGERILLVRILLTVDERLPLLI